MTHAQKLRHLLELFDTCAPMLREEAMVSYWRYNGILREIGEDTGFDVETAAGVFSALSPNNDYIGNLRDARKLLDAAAEGRAITDFTVSTYGQNKRKAWEIARRRTGFLDLFEKYTSRKTRSFFLNCWRPDCPEAVTVDGHMFWAWTGRRGVVKARNHKREDAPPSINGTLYDEIADALRLVAEIRGVIPNQAQAVIWQNYRMRHNVQRVQQSELFASDRIAARVPEEKAA